MTANSPDGVLITGVYGSGKSSVAAEIAFVLEQGGEPFALLDLDFLGWGGVPPTSPRITAGPGSAGSCWPGSPAPRTSWT